MQQIQAQGDVVVPAFTPCTICGMPRTFIWCTGWPLCTWGLALGKKEETLKAKVCAED